MDSPGRAELDTWTVAAIALGVYATANLIHEGLGHGGACLLMGGTPRQLNAIFFDSDPLPDWKARLEAAGGSIANVLALLLTLPLLRSARTSPHLRFACWLFCAVNALQPSGYLMFSGIGKFGDWEVVLDGLMPEPIWRIGATAIGAFFYFFVARQLIIRTLEPFLGTGADRIARARKLMLLPYVLGGIEFVTAGLLNPQSPVLVLVSGAAASFGGTSLLAWAWGPVGPGQPDAAQPLGVPRSTRWIAAGLIAAAIFIGVFGPGIAFSPLRWPIPR